ncbi:phenylalanine--tRNA ligase subunit alpha [Ehrlichia canis]|uniref:Phenylalanine--tRNA ligase alpha subunit n=1 Tax=Ehrlichia canis (strain Jake) TaxID=269484 RepID=SYFA_EHRCJ|nr:phenylalanine--tRNA ligase subunit alpha [Ehrlichia canis]Q3YSX1.1 RecName: Full=Phenylalanine--tRNA ligase alpha subunit; AltName: Full=Phenylalanyl-tRNA synthetase alpha subunit; Short=PheRS [Ehrlichia canis str. Jake]AAZ68184.1 phenylalanyl-tRNA synthetase, alpha subunit [Ehrlichia canis str. Jake]AUO54438.1 phenylalanine--tRNA ligase subunit alpha [Ehrlichia canis]UKC53270.1 pheS [Ehrlichia canis]UKC54207.1 pheS [Ehrlichia canis]UKC55143.1 pheS [Ehrlichia canis]
MLHSNIYSLQTEATNKILSTSSLEELESLRLYYFGKSGVITACLRSISTINNIEERKSIGSAVNSICAELKSLMNSQKEKLHKIQIDAQLMEDKIDISLPVRPKQIAKLHPISKTLHEVKHIFVSLGFKLSDGPELEDEFHVFDALNTHKHHPAREENDTFYLKKLVNNKRIVLRTHTSSVQIRTMESNNGNYPIKIIAPGKVYRNDWDATHSPMFHQIEGLYIDKNINMGHLKYCINYFLKKFFGENIQIRFRNSYFPFTEPSAEVDIKCSQKNWMEILGCGMVHHNVLTNVNINPEQYSGFAFGIGIERIAMIKYNINDLRKFYSNKLQWLTHHGFCFTNLIT